MRRYTSTQYRGTSRRRRIGRIVFLCVLAAAILASLLILGNILHDRLEQAAPLRALPIVTYAEETTAAPAAYVPFRGKDAPTGIYCAPDAALIAAGDARAMQESCAAAAELYDGISVTAADDAGIRYILEDSAAGDLPKLRTLNEAANAFSLTSCAIWKLPDAIPDRDSDTCAAVRTLAESGFDEILFIGITAASLSGRDIAAMTALSDAIKESSTSMRIGFALDAAVFADIDSIPALESLAAQVDFLAVDLGTPSESGEAAAAFAREQYGALYGSIAYYPLRVLIRGDTSSAAAQTEALRELGVQAIQPIP